MEIERMGANITKLIVDDGLEIFYSYGTPVAGWKRGEGYFQTDRYYSKTTSKHLGIYLKGNTGARKVSQAWIDGLVNGGQS